MRPRLLPCTQCQRHVRVSDASCPFCGVELGLRTAPPVPSVARLSRTARVAVGAALASLTLPACGGPPEPAAPPPAGTAEPIDDGAPAPEYGAPAPIDDDGAPAAEYGAPPTDDDATMAPEYGAPAPDEE